MALGKFSPTEKAESGLEFTLLNPATGVPLFDNGDGTSSRVFVTVHGSDSKVCKNILRRQSNHRIELASKARGKRPKITAEMIEAEGLEILVGCTKSWRTETVGEDGLILRHHPGKIEINEGEWIEVTPENVQAAFEVLPWMKEQVDDQIGDRTDFLQN